MRIGVLLAVSCVGCGLLRAEDFGGWQPLAGGVAAVSRDSGRLVLQGSEWSYMASAEAYGDCEFAVTLSVDAAASQFDFFGSGWSAWPDPKFGDRGFEAGLLLRGAVDGSSGYRLQFSTKYQECALVRFPEGGYLKSVPCRLEAGVAVRVRFRVSGNRLQVFVDDRELFEHVDRLEPGLESGLAAVGVSSNGKVTFSNGVLRRIERQPADVRVPHQLKLSSRRWLGGRQFVFDDNQPILQLHYAGDPSMFARLRPDLRPMLTFDSHWGLENQGAFKEAAVVWTEPEVAVDSRGESLSAVWSAKHVGDRFTTTSRLTVGYDESRDAYVYEIESQLQMLAGPPFQFRYGFDFEHHTPLDPFRWEYLLIRGRDGELSYRPLSPFDPGPLEDIEPVYGLRAWHGRTGERHVISPVVEYQIQPDWIELPGEAGEAGRRQLNTAVCAAFYDTGVAFAPASLREGDRLKVRYRYTGYPAEEVSRMFARSKVQSNPRIDPARSFIFAGDQWPRIEFSRRVGLDRPWWGGRPFLSGHNARPTYDFVDTGGAQLRLGPTAFAAAPVGPVDPLPGRWLVTARVRSVNAVGPGGRLEVLCLKKADVHGNGYVLLDEGNILSRRSGWFGAGSFDWREQRMVVDVPTGTGGLALCLGNGGTGEVFVSEVRFEPLEAGSSVESSLLAAAPVTASAAEVLWDLRMEEQSGLYVYNHGSAENRLLELANVDWVVDSGRPSLRFAENPRERADFPPLGLLDTWLRNPNLRSNYEPHRHGAFGLGGFHGGGRPLRALTLAAWIRPAAAMGLGPHPGRGDILGYGARRFIVGLDGQSAPYRLAAWLNVNDRLVTESVVEADRWQHVALTCSPADGQWRVTLYLNGEEAGSGLTTKLGVDEAIPDSLILGGEYFYLHCHYYRGLIGAVHVMERCLTGAELRVLAGERP
ncbi:MAG: Concanavalin A-like lectin/glucanase superfamily [Planctomycetota bacterium]